MSSSAGILRIIFGLSSAALSLTLLFSQATERGAASGPVPKGSDPKLLNFPEGPKAPTKTSVAEAARQPIKNLGAGIAEIGLVRIDNNLHTVTFPARLNVTDAAIPLEYVLVNHTGKAHESLLTTTVEPYHLQLGLLLLGAKPGGSPESVKAMMKGQLTNTVMSMGSSQLVHPGSEKLPGERVEVEFSWQTPAATIRKRAEELVYNTSSKASAKSSEWVFNGSRIANGVFYAQIDGSMISLVTDGNSVINYEGAGHDNDKSWVAQTNAIPPAGAPVTVTLRVPKRSRK